MIYEVGLMERKYTISLPSFVCTLSIFLFSLLSHSNSLPLVIFNFANLIYIRIEFTYHSPEFMSNSFQLKFFVPYAEKPISGQSFRTSSFSSFSNIKHYVMFLNHSTSTLYMLTSSLRP